MCYEGREGQTGQSPSFMPEYTDVLIPVLHHRTIAYKCDLCCYDLQGYCRHGTRCTYAHPWENALNGFVQFAQYYNRMTSLNVI